MEANQQDYAASILPPIPNRLWAVIVMLGAIGGLLLVVSIYSFFQITSFFSYGGLGVDLGLSFTLLLMIPFVFGAGLLYLARRLQQSDRVARILATMTCVAIAAASLLTSDRDLGWILTGLLAIGAVLMLTIDPVVKNHFLGSGARYANEPLPVVAARTLMVIVAACDTFVGLAFLILSPYGAHYAVWGILILAVAISFFVLSRQLALGNDSARLITTLVFAAYLVVSLVIAQGEPGIIVPVALSLTVVGLLWGPETSRDYFLRKTT